MTLSIAEQERLYDLQKSGELYRKPEQPVDIVQAALRYIDQIAGDTQPYDYDTCIAAIERLEAAIGIPPHTDEVPGTAFDQATADALDVFTAWWRKARRDRQPA